MTILYTILAIIGGIIILFLLLALAIKKEFSLQKEIVIDRPTSTVFEFIRQIRNQEKYSVWVMRDPNVKMVYTGTDGTVGFISAWESKDKNVGVGEQEIKRIKEGENMEVEIRFKKPFEAVNYALTSVSTTADRKTKVTNLFYGTSKFPMNVMNLFMDKLVGRDMQQNLVNLKNVLEKES